VLLIPAIGKSLLIPADLRLFCLLAKRVERKLKENPANRGD
jgi:hypothetical protein